MRPPSEAPRFGYIPALDGLRAVAILMVVAYHLGWLRGGFLGVDVFFALSGFLITSVLLQEWDATTSIDLRRFYGRRLLRLAPALSVLVASLFLATHVLFPELGSSYLQGRWAAAALLYVSDLLIAFRREYPLGQVSICWSLAIEEQFYLLWPLGLLALLRRGVSPARAGLLLLVASAIPLVLREVLVRQQAGDPTLWLRIYFAPDTRADTLLVGCALALFFAGRTERWPRAGLVAAGAAAATLGWFAATHSIGDMVARPILLSLTAVASATLLFGVLQGGVLGRVLATPAFVWVGRLSYSM